MSDNNNNNNEKSPEQIRHETEQRAERDAQLVKLKRERIVDQVFQESGFRFRRPNATVLRFCGGTLEFDADDQPFIGGRPLSEAIKGYAQLNPHGVAETLAETHRDTGVSAVKSKADLKTTRDIVDYISATGSELAYARLPKTAPVTVPTDELTPSQYRQLSVREKSLILSEKGEQWVARLLYSEGDQARMDRLMGVPHGKKK